jgi:hypothetical protein
MSYSEACCSAADRTKKTHLVHIVREIAPGTYAVFMTGQESELHK